ncbi:hypothetical protein [Morganella morganii]|uniref:hypothetical protein n=1 Tax=Morganella morganii TaxID=582 RepID=UPI001330D69B|nr:hypothetical protein [Morganella morganii]HAT3835999.1 hypothetical protein [Morganella morganii]HCT9735926.1 hypothetical protein [Morganella morganii]HEI8681918.1 hypothetical protein [Morganella morganii]
MKVKLLNDGGYAGLENIIFPVVVEVNNHYDSGFDVAGSELILIGGDGEHLNINFDYYFSISIGECEAINEQIS